MKPGDDVLPIDKGLKEINGTGCGYKEVETESLLAVGARNGESLLFLHVLLEEATMQAAAKKGLARHELVPCHSATAIALKLTTMLPGKTVTADCDIRPVVLS